MYFANKSIGVRPIYDEISEVWYGVSREDVEWVLERCTICKLDEFQKGKAIVKPIETWCCIDRIEFDFINFKSLANNLFKWVLQIKDTFSRYIWLYVLEDKSSESVAKALAEWLGQNGNPWAFCCDNSTEFKG
jgi:hypothetical protein